MKQRRFRPWRWIREWFQFKFTPVGRWSVFLLILSFPGFFTVEIPIYQVLCGIATLYFVAETIGIALQPRVRVSGVLPDKVAAGETALGLVTVENIGWLPACDLMCGLFGLPPSIRHLNGNAMIPSLRRGERESMTVTLQADRRGEFAMPAIRVHSTFPLNILRFGGASVPLGKLSVTPAFHRLEHLEIPISHRYQHGGILLESRSGNAAEYVGNREYIPGEPTRRLDFRAWARTGRPVVREYQDEFCSRVALVLDTHLPRSGWLGWKRGGGASEDIEAAVSLTASLADVLGRMGTLIELFAAGPDLFFFETGPEGLTSQEAILEILAAVEPTRHNPFEKLTPVIAESLESTSVVVCLFVDWDEAREELVNRIVQSGCGLRAFLVRTGPPTRPFPDEELYTHLSPADVLTGRIWTL